MATYKKSKATSLVQVPGWKAWVTRGNRLERTDNVMCQLLEMARRNDKPHHDTYLGRMLRTLIRYKCPRFVKFVKDLRRIQPSWLKRRVHAWKVGDVVSDTGVIYLGLINERTRGGCRLSLFKCSCGKKFKCAAPSIKSQNTKSCGCGRRRWSAERTNEQLIGRDFESGVVVLRRLGCRANKTCVMYEARCHCGKLFARAASAFLGNRVKSCGCNGKIRDEVRLTIITMYKSGIPLADIVSKTGVSNVTIGLLVRKSGVPNRRLLNHRTETAYGETKSVAAWSHDVRCVVSPGTLWARVYRKWNFEKALSTRV